MSRRCNIYFIAVIREATALVILVGCSDSDGIRYIRRAVIGNVVVIIARGCYHDYPMGYCIINCINLQLGVGTFERAIDDISAIINCIINSIRYIGIISVSSIIKRFNRHYF